MLSLHTIVYSTICVFLKFKGIEYRLISNKLRIKVSLFTVTHFNSQNMYKIYEICMCTHMSIHIYTCIYVCLLIYSSLIYYISSPIHISFISLYTSFIHSSIYSNIFYETCIIFCWEKIINFTHSVHMLCIYSNILYIFRKSVLFA